MFDILKYLFTGDCGNACGHYRGIGWIAEDICFVHSPDKRFMNWIWI